MTSIIFILIARLSLNRLQKNKALLSTGISWGTNIVLRARVKDPPLNVIVFHDVIVIEGR